jgi:multidrug resistance efflux pump
MKLEQVERNNRVHVRIPREHVCCPSCGTDQPGIITLDLETLTEERFQAMKQEGLFPAEQPLRCTDCEWEGTAFDVYQAALRREKRSAPVRINFTREEVEVLKDAHDVRQAAAQVELTRKDLKTLKVALGVALMEYRANMVAEEIGEGGSPERQEQWREKVIELRRVMGKLP